MATSQMGTTRSARAFLASGQAAQVHRAWDTTNCTYDPVQDKYVPSKPQSIRTVAAGPTTHFLKVMEAFRKNFPDNDVVAKFNIRDSHNWEEVLLTAGMADERYHASRKGFRGLFKRVGRKVGDVNPTISPFLSTLPQGEYTSIACGGIILIFNAFKRMSEIRQRVVGKLGEAAQLLEQVEDFVRLYPDDQKLNECAIKLYIALLVAVEGIIKWFDHRTWDRLKAFMQQGLYGRALEDKLDFLDDCAENVKTQADICDKEKTVEISEAIKIQLSMIAEVQDLVRQKGDENIDATMNLSRVVDDGFDTVRGDVKDARKDLDESIEGISRKLSDRFGDVKLGTDSGFDEMRNSFAQFDIGMEALRKENNDGMSIISKQILEAINSFKSQMSNNERLLGWQRETERLHRRAEALELQLQQIQTTPETLAQPEVLRLLGHISQLGVLNIEHYVRAAKIVNESPELTGAIMSTPQFRFWLTSTTSQMLFVDASMPWSKISPSTYVTASLAQILLDMPPAITLAHFCRGIGNDRQSNPASLLMASLISQLLAIREYDLRKWSEVQNLQDHYEALENQDLGYLCSFFKYLVNSLPYGTIFCLIDDFFHLEQHTDWESLSRVIRTLSGLVDRTGINSAVIFKTLIMVPDRRGNVVHFARDEDLLRIEGTGKALNSGGDMMTPKQLRLQMEFAGRKGGMGPAI